MGNYLFYNNYTKVDWIKTRLGWGKTILDVGCADGMMWLDKAFPVTLLDKEVREGDEPCHPDIIAEAESLPLDDNSFDIVILAEILEHLEQPELAVREAIRVAKLKVLITVPWEAQWDLRHKPFTHPQHLNYFTAETLDEFLSQFRQSYQMQFLQFLGMVWIGAEIYCCEKK